MEQYKQQIATFVGGLSASEKNQFKIIFDTFKNKGKNDEWIAKAIKTFTNKGYNLLDNAGLLNSKTFEVEIDGLIYKQTAKQQSYNNDVDRYGAMRDRLNARIEKEKLELSKTNAVIQDGDLPKKVIKIKRNHRKLFQMSILANDF